MAIRENDPQKLQDWMVKTEQRLRSLENRRLEAGDGLAQDHATKTMGARISDDPGNSASIGEDGGIKATDTVTSASEHNPLYIQKYLTTNGTIPNNADTDFIWTSEVKNGTWVTTSTDITIPEAGFYLVCVQMQWQQNATGVRAIHVYGIPGTVPTTSFASETFAPPGTNETAQNLVAIKDFAAGATLRVSVFQNSGISLTAGGPYGGDVRGRWTVFKLFDAYPPALAQSTA